MRKARLTRHPVQIHTPTETRSSSGESIPTYARAEDIWASVEPLRGQELFLAQQVDAATTIRVRMRYTSTLAMTSRIVHEGRNLEVLSILNKDDRNVDLEVMCREDVA